MIFFKVGGLVIVLEWFKHLKRWQTCETRAAAQKEIKKLAS